MIWVLFGIFVVLAIIFGILSYVCWDSEEAWQVLTAVMTTVAFIVLIIGIWLGVTTQRMNYIDEKIDYLEAENAKIDEEILSIVTSFQGHEAEFYENFKNTSATTLINLYPELKSDVLVNKQIEIYLKNRNEIKELQLQNIEASVYRWWAYFGH